MIIPRILIGILSFSLLTFTPLLQVSATGYAPELVTRSSDSLPVNAYPYSVSYSDDGNLVEFSSYDDNIDTRATDSTTQVYVRNRSLNYDDLISVNNAGQLSDGQSGELKISGNGSFAFFLSSYATNLDNEPSGVKAYARDLNSNTTELIDSTDTYGNLVYPLTPSAFYSNYEGTILLFDGINFTSLGVSDGGISVYRYDMHTGVTQKLLTHASIDSGNYQQNTTPELDQFTYRDIDAQSTRIYNYQLSSDSLVSDDATPLALSADGKYVFFYSQSPDITNSIPESCQYTGCLFRYNLLTATVELINPLIQGLSFSNGLNIAITKDGNTVAYGGVDNETGIVIYNIDTGQSYIAGYGPNFAIPDYKAGQDPIHFVSNDQYISFSNYASNFGTPVHCVREDGVQVTCDNTYVGMLIQKPALSVPFGLNAATPTNSPSIAWSSSDGAVTYNVYRNGIKIGSTATTSYIDANASQATYSYTVSAVNSFGESEQSTSVLVAVDKTRPTMLFSAPVSFNDVFNVGPTISVNASDVSGLKQLVIHVYVASTNQLLTTCGSANAAQLAAGSMSCSLASLPTGSYYIKAGSFDNANNNQTINSGTFVIIRS